MGQNFYKRDDRDVQFVLKEQLGIGRLLEFEQYREFTLDDFDMILSQAQKVASEVVAPTFQDGDREGCRFEDGKVMAPKPFHDVWKVYKDGGWFSLAQKTNYGGQGLPLIIAEAAQEFFMSANFSFGCYAGLGPGNGSMIEKYGTQAQKDLFLRKMYDGTWGGAMCLTESGVGSDAHMVTTRAIPDGDFYRIEGTKIFITSGDHDLTKNIIHLVIARIKGAPEGAKGVSLFAVPKIWVNPDGSLGEPNDVACQGIEHKLGLNGSATCVMGFGENGKCRGHLIGQPGMGLAYMFDMVNLARMAVGLESVAFGANIYANVLAYAKDRIQGVPFGKKGDRVRIIEHDDVRRMLMNIKALTEGMRALVYKSYFMEDFSKSSPVDEERKAAQGRLELLTPLIKAFCSDHIFNIGREGIQILGGYGFTKEYPVEQYMRDCKIFSIWDGTNYIQSMDLIGRKLQMQSGNVFAEWVNEVTQFISKGRSRECFSMEMELLDEALEALKEVVSMFSDSLKSGDGNWIPLAGTRFLDCMAEVAIGHLLMDQAFIAGDALRKENFNQADKKYYEGKIKTVRFYMRNILPNVFGRIRIIKQKDISAIQIKEEEL